MNNILSVTCGVGGLALLYYGADGLVRGGSTLAARLKVPPLVIGLTLIAFGTSAPEFFVSVGAAWHGLGDICVGNIVGSNICNIALILGLTALIAPVAVNPKIIRRDIPVMIAASLALTVRCLVGGGLGRLGGVAFLLALAVYTFASVAALRDQSDASEEMTVARGSAWAVAATVGGLAMLVVGAKLLLLAAVAIERELGVSDEVIALTVVAVGTSLPELATSVIAAQKGEADIAIGNVVGSNIFNILGILGVSSLVVPVTAGGIGILDYGMMVVTAVMLAPLVVIRRKLGRIEGVILLLTYVGYLTFLVAGN